MPYKPMKPCRVTGCPNLTYGKYCTKHASLETNEASRAYNELRPSAAKRGYNSKWQKARRTYLNNHPLCAECKRKGRITPATVVDHIIPHKGNSKLFWDTNNWQPLCKQCHDRKTATEDGGFGRQAVQRNIPDISEDEFHFV